MNLLQSMVIAFAMYSKIPMPEVEWNEKNMKYAMCFFPLVGAAEGIFVFLIGNLLIKSMFGTLFFAVVMTLLQIMITGGIHMDGFLDTVDALNSWGNQDKKLEILKDSNSGAFAVIGMGCYLLADLALWSEVSRECLPAVALGYVLSRALSGYSVVTWRSARDSGLAKAFHDAAHKRNAARGMHIWIWGSIICMLVYNLKIGTVSVVCAGLVFIGYKRLCEKQFGGVTGDLAGYFLQTCELAMLAGIALTARIPDIL